MFKLSPAGAMSVQGLQETLPLRHGEGETLILNKKLRALLEHATFNKKQKGIFFQQCPPITFRLDYLLYLINCCNKTHPGMGYTE